MSDQPTNPYAAPSSDVDDIQTNGEVTFCEAQKLTAGRGHRFIADAWGIYKKAPVMWTVNALVLVIILMVLGVMPLLSVFGAIVYTPLFAGLLIGALEVEQGKDLTFAQLFEGVKQRGKKLFGLGAVYTGLSVLSMIVPFIFIDSQMMSVMFLGSEMDPARLQQNLLGIGFAFILFFALMLLLVMATWFATPLVALQDEGVFRAMEKSFKACMKNFWAMTVYVLLLHIWLLLALLPLGLGMLIFLPVLMISVYTGYKAIFTQPAS